MEQEGTGAVPTCSRSHGRSSAVLKHTHKHNTFIFSLVSTHIGLVLGSNLLMLVFANTY